MPHFSALKLFIPATIRVMYSRTAADRRRIGRSFVAGDGDAFGGKLLAGDGFAWSMDSSALVAARWRRAG
jgi:hypothetical protein